MNHEGASPIAAMEARERPHVGKLSLLGHPGTPDTFSGYGLVTGKGRWNHLVGLLMVDRPHVVDLQWLARIQEVYGEYLLVPMTNKVLSQEDQQELQARFEKVEEGMEHGAHEHLEQVTADLESRLRGF